MNIETEVKIIGLSTIQVALERAQAPYGAISKTGIRMVGHAANVGREILAQQFTDRDSGDLRYNSPARPFYSPFRTNKMGKRVARHREPLIKNKSGYYDSRGDKYRLIHYSLKGRFGVKSAHLSSYPMNLWERRKDGRSKWIMTVKLAPLVAAQAPRFVDKAERELEADMERLMRGGK
jgi:hypothetical protein